MRTETLQELGHLWEPDGVYELRALGSRNIGSGYFDTPEKLLEIALAGKEKGVNWYMTTSPVDSALLARRRNRLEPWAKSTTKDSEIPRRRMLFIDLDPVRASGIPSTNEEHKAAISRAGEIREVLGVAGWPEPIVMDSGNGAYLLYRIDLPNDEKALALVKRVLAGLDTAFSDDNVHVDQAVANAARLFRVPGALNQKGDGAPDRPHRVAQILSSPEAFEVVEEGMLKRVVDWAPETESGPPYQGKRNSGVQKGIEDIEDWVSSHGMEIARKKAWNGGVLLELDVCPFDENHRRTASVVRFADGALSFRCFHDSCSDKKWRDLRRLCEPEAATPKVGSLPALAFGVSEPDSVPSPESNSLSGRYLVEEGRIMRIKAGSPDPVLEPLCNFDARIMEEIIFDDGAREEVRFLMEGKLASGESLAVVVVPVSQFAGMGWVTAQWGLRAVVYAGQTLKDHLRVAIQELSRGAKRRTVFGHFGWRRIKDNLFFLHTGGAIGADGAVGDIEVDTGCDSLRDFLLPPPPEETDLTKAVKASLDLVHLAPPRIMAPLLGGLWRSVLGKWAPIDFSLYAAGPSGVQKTEAAAAVQSHFGMGFRGKNLPANWASTANSLEKTSHAAKDCLLTVDDFAPTGSRGDVNRLHRDADRLLRAQGNRAGRGRLQSDGQTRPTYYPRGLILATGEDIPRGVSLRARLVVLEFEKRDVDLKVLTEAQRNAAKGVYAASMSGFLCWLARNEPQKVPQRLEELRSEARREIRGHDRAPDNAAGLILGWEYFFRFAIDAGALTAEEAEDSLGLLREAIFSTLRAQQSLLRDQEPAERFISLLSAAISSGAAHLRATDNENPPAGSSAWGWVRREKLTGEVGWEAQGRCVGWIREDHVFLDPETAYAVAQEMASRQQAPLPNTARTIQKHLEANGLLVKCDKGQRTVVREIGSGRKRVLCLAVSTFRGDGLENSDFSEENAEYCNKAGCDTDAA